MKKLTLNIYEGGKIAKTYEAETADILYGTLEDLIKIIDVDKISAMSDSGTQLEIGKMVIKMIPLLTPFLREVFIGVTDEELRKIKVREMIPLFVEIVKYAFSELTAIGGDNSGN